MLLTRRCERRCERKRTDVRRLIADVVTRIATTTNRDRSLERNHRFVRVEARYPALAGPDRVGVRHWRERNWTRRLLVDRTSAIHPMAPRAANRWILGDSFG